MRQRWKLNDGRDVSEMADHMEPGGLGTWYDEQGAGKPVVLLARGQAADGSQADGLLDRALAAVSSLEMGAVTQLIEALRAVQAGGRSPAAPAMVAPEVSRYLFRREGEYWTVCYQGTVVRLRDAKGLRHLARLLTHPGREFHAVDLEAAYKARLAELRAELEEAQGSNDPVRAAKARVERDFLVRELARAVGLGGRDRRAASHAERARLNATRAIRTAIGNLERAHPALGGHLAATIRTGRYCSYTPDPRLPITWEP
jgi:hypothetical protein